MDILKKQFNVCSVKAMIMNPVLRKKYIRYLFRAYCRNSSVDNGCQVPLFLLLMYFLLTNYFKIKASVFEISLKKQMNTRLGTILFL